DRGDAAGPPRRPRLDRRGDRVELTRRAPAREPITGAPSAGTAPRPLLGDDVRGEQRAELGRAGPPVDDHAAAADHVGQHARVVRLGLLRPHHVALVEPPQAHLAGLVERAGAVDVLLGERPRLIRVDHSRRPCRSTITQNTPVTTSYGGSTDMWPRCASSHRISPAAFTAFQAWLPPLGQRVMSTAAAPWPPLCSRWAIGTKARRPSPTNSNRCPSHCSARATPPTSPSSDGRPTRSYSGWRGAATTGSPCQVE